MRHALIAVVLSVVALPAQGPRGVMPKPGADHVYGEHRDFTTLVVKFREGAPVRLRDGVWNGDDVEASNALLARASDVRRLFQTGEAELDRDRAALLTDLPEGMDPPADLNNYYHVSVASEEEGRALLHAFNALDQVEIAFPEHASTFPCEPGDIPPVTPSFESGQNYRDPAPTGIDHRASRVIGGGRGNGLQVIDIESSWQLDHEDIPQLVQANVIGPHQMFLNPNHGVAVVGEIAAEWDVYGITGICDQTDAKVHSHQRQFWAQSVLTAAQNTPVGGFIVLEVQLGWQGRTMPMEVREDVFDAVRNTTMAGKHVIAAAGNGSNNMDDPFFQNLFNRSVRDSGSVLVGATTGAPLTRASFSNYGSAVDANGWGGSVQTTGYGDLFTGGSDPRQYYTSGFSGTSSATPIVTGAAMALYGAVLEQQGRALTPSELRDALRQHGTPVPNGNIGVRPDLVQLLTAFGLPNGMDIPVEGRLGGTATVELSGTSGTGYAVFASTQRGFVDLGPIGRFLIDPSTAVVPYGGTIPGGGLVSLQVGVPNVPQLSEVTLFMQGVFLDQGQAQLTNSVQNYIY